jgi:DNA repair protein RecO
MKEYFTEAIILNRGICVGADRLVEFYTKDLGRVEAKVRGGSKILSKLSPHLDFLNLVTLRLVFKNHYTVADALTKNNFRALKKDVNLYEAAANMVFLVNSLVPKELPDLRLWHEMIYSLKKGDFDFAGFLKFLGYDPQEAICEICAAKKPKIFWPKEQVFLCPACSVKFSQNELILIA